MSDTIDEIFQIAIDGPSGAGKSVAARKVAAVLGIEYIDTGAMYRAVAFKILTKKIDPEDREKIAEIIKKTEVEFIGGRVFLDGRDVSGFIRTNEISNLASDCSALPEVRAMLVKLQREMGEKKSVVMDGRDIGSNVFPDAKYKFFLTATPEERARRRHLELEKKGVEISFGKVLSDIKTRDENDSSRELNPLIKTDDAIEIDSTDMTEEEVSVALINHLEITRK